MCKHNKILGANQDESLSFLQELLDQGFDKAEWVWDQEDYDICYELDGNVYDLFEFIDGLMYEAPIFELSHVNCKCKLKVTNDATGEEVYVNYTGIIDDTRYDEEGNYTEEEGEPEVEETEGEPETETEEITVGEPEVEETKEAKEKKWYQFWK